MTWRGATIVLAGILAFLVCGLAWAGIGHLALEAARAATRQEMSIIERINQAVNGSIRYQTDQAQYGVNDRWVADPPSMRGDCEDFALTKVRRLLAAGFAPGRVAVQIVIDELGETHAVAVVDDEVILDNRFSWTQSRLTLQRYGYRFGVRYPAVVP